MAELNLQEFLGEGPDFLLPLDFRQDMLAFNTQAEGAEQPTRSDTYFSRSASGHSFTCLRAACKSTLTIRQCKLTVHQ